MELLRELLQINHDAEMSDLFEELGNLGKLGLGPMVNAFKQTYAVYHRRGGDKNTSKEGNKFSTQHGAIGKDSETIDVGHVKNWTALRREYKKNAEGYPLAAIFKVDDKPVALLIASESDTTSVNDRVGLAWDFSKLNIDEEEGKKLVAGLNTKGKSWRTEVIGTDKKALASIRTDKEKERDYDFTKGEYVEKFTSQRYAGFTQTVREIVPFVNNLGATFGTRLTVSLVMADKVRMGKRGERAQNRPIDPKDLKLFKDDLSTRLAKYKNTKVDTAEDAEDFVKKVFGGGLKKLKFAGRTYSAVPEKEYMGSSGRSGSGKHEYFYNGTFATLLSGKPATMKFEADRKEGDYNTLYLTVKFVNGSLVPVEMSYSESYGKSQTVKF
jgi:hypothetical protein